MSVYGIIALAVVCCIVVVMLQQYKPEFALIITIAAGCIILASIITRFGAVLGELRTIAENSGIKSEYIEIMLKGLGICYLTQFSCDICNDFGQTSLASKIELCGKVTLAALSVPLILSLIDIITNLV